MDSFRILYFIIPISIIAFTFILIIILKAVKAQRAERNHIAADLLGDFNVVRTKHPITTYEGDYGGEKVIFTHHPGSKNQAPYFTIALEIPVKSSLKIKKESKFEGFFKKIGLTREIQVGDREFDDRLFINSRSEKFARLYLSDTAKIEKIKELFNFKKYPVEFIEIKRGWILLNIKTGRDRLVKMEKKQVLEYLDILMDLKKNLPEVTAAYEDIFSNTSGRKIIHAIFAFVGLIDISGLVLLIIGISRYLLVSSDLYWNSFYYSVPLLLLFWLFVLPNIKGRSDSHIIFIIILFMSLFAFLIGTMGFFVFTNGYLDTSELTTFNSRIVDKYFVRGKDSTSYYIRIEYWGEQRDSVKISVPYSIYEEFNLWDRIKVDTRKGYWGYEWIASYSKTEGFH